MCQFEIIVKNEKTQRGEYKATIDADDLSGFEFYGQTEKEARDKALQYCKEMLTELQKLIDAYQ